MFLPILTIQNLLERARRNRGRLANTPCLFTARHQEPDDIDLAPEIHEDDEPEEYFASTTAGESIQFWPWVNKVFILDFCGFVHVSVAHHNECPDANDSFPRATSGNRHANFQADGVGA